MQVWLPLLLIRQIFAPMKLEDTKPATLEKVVDEEGGGGGSVGPSQLTDGKLHSLGSWTDLFRSSSVVGSFYLGLQVGCCKLFVSI